MNKTLLVIIVLLVLGGLGYYAYTQGWVSLPQTMQGDGDGDTDAQTNTGNTAPQGKHAAYTWTFADATTGGDDVPHTSVKVTTAGKTYDLGRYEGSCREVPAGERGVVNDLADQGEVSRAQCWYAGGGNEIGVFETGATTVVVKVGELSEGSAEEPFFRGNFKTLLTLN